MTPNKYIRTLSRMYVAFVRLSGIKHHSVKRMVFKFDGEFDPGSERTLAAWIRHASRARKLPSGG